MICPHCQHEISKFSLTVHTNACVHNPQNIALLKQWLPDPVYPGCIRLMLDYDQNTPARPSREHLLSAYGTWQALADAYGLKFVSYNERHISAKLQGTHAELRRLSKELHRGRYSPTQNDYAIYAAGNDSCLQCDNLIKRFGSWPAVLAHFEMTLPLAPVRHSWRSDDEPEMRYQPPFWFAGLYDVTSRPTTFTIT